MQKLVLSLGMPRCATSWMHRQFLDHPEIEAVPRKELHYFRARFGTVNRLSDRARQRAFKAFVQNAKMIESTGAGPDQRDMSLRDWAADGVNTQSFDAFHRDLDWYVRFLQGPVCEEWYRRLHARVSDRAWAVDFSTTNAMVSDEGFVKMSGFCPDTRALLVLRHPLDRLWSHIRLHAKVLGLKKKVEDWSRGEITEFVKAHNLFEPDLYASAVRKTLTYFRPEARLIMAFDEVARDPHAALTRAFGHLDLDVPEVVAARIAIPRPASPPVQYQDVLADFIGPGLQDLRAVKALGVGFVQPWIDDLVARKRMQGGSGIFASTPVLLAYPTPKPDAGETDTDRGTTASGVQSDPDRNVV